MKTFHSFILSMLIGGSVMAQQLNTTTPPAKNGVEQVDAATAARIKQVHMRKKTAHAMASGSVHEYLGPTDAIVVGTNGQATKYYVNPLFCDSSVTTKFGTAAASNVQVQKAGGMFDPKSALYGTNALPNWEPYFIDTVWVAGSYKIRTTSANAKDTLIVEISWGFDTSSFYSALTSTTPAEKWRLPKTTVSKLSGDKSVSTAPAMYSVKLKHVLTVADTITVGTAGANWPFIALVPSTAISIPANAIVGIQYTYANKSAIPANKVYYTSPTNTATMNSYLAFEAADSSATSHHYFYDSTSWGTSATAYTHSRYGLYPAAQAFLNGALLPETDMGYLWDLSISHTPLVTAAKDLPAVLAGVVLHQNIPNPFTGTSLINFELPASSDVEFTVYDLAGRMVSEISLGRMDAGQHSHTIQAAEFSKGIYFYTLRANGVSVSKKMVISE